MNGMQSNQRLDDFFARRAAGIFDPPRNHARPHREQRLRRDGGVQLGIGEAIAEAVAEGARDELRAMYREWPFFRSTMDLVEMVLAKASPGISAYYDARLVPAALLPLGQRLRGDLQRTIDATMEVTGHAQLLAENPVLRRSIDVRNPYVDPINLVQVEVLTRLRADDDDPTLLDAFLVTVNGVAAGMRNTG
jgi:phosphoenolpyruvate carboxylase